MGSSLTRVAFFSLCVQLFNNSTAERFSASDLSSDGRVVRMWGSSPGCDRGACVAEQDT